MYTINKFLVVTACCVLLVCSSSTAFTPTTKSIQQQQLTQQRTSGRFHQLQQQQSSRTAAATSTTTSLQERRWNFNDGQGPFGFKKNAEIWNGRVAQVRVVDRRRRRRTNSEKLSLGVGMIQGKASVYIGITVRRRKRVTLHSIIKYTTGGPTTGSVY